ncbi:gamma-tubulin complex component protein [Pilaira anomala]|nr:gamma-tubulin complex component protein [Pilaira anomala]
MDDSTASSTDDTNVWNTIKYDIDPTLDPSLKHLVEKLLPLATYYISVQAFVELYARYEYGTINHALCSGIRVFLKEYLTFIAQLEHQFQTSTRFTLQRLWFYAQNTLQNMKVLHDLAMTIRSIQIPPKPDEEEDFDAVIEGLQKEEATDEVQIPEEKKGGAILNILSERLIGLSGDPNCKKIYTYLLSAASVPYFEILNAWIYHGEIKDPYNEFMVLEKRNVNKENLKEDFNDTYWEMRYTIREGGVPIFLETMKTQILLAGKYLNVVRECGVSIANPEEMQNEMSGLVQELNINSDRGNGPFMSTRSEVWAAVDGSRFVKNLQVAYKYANQTLLNLLMEDQQLIGRLRSIKHYFFLDQSDFLTSFLDLAKDELKQSASKIPQSRLQSLMDLVLRNPSSVAAYDPFKEDVKVSMSHFRLIDQLLCIINPSSIEGGGIKDPRIDSFERSQSLSSSTMSSVIPTSTDLSGYEALILDYTVTFPLSLIISRKALTKYQLLFRHILNMKHVEDLLCNAWMEQKNEIWKKRSNNPEIEQWKSKIFSLRNRMLTFVQQFAYYVTNEVLEPNYRRLETNLTSISTVDQVLQFHSDFLDTCLTECMLTNSKLLRVSC